MKNTFKITVLLVLFFSLMSMNVQEKDFHVKFEQHGEMIEPVNEFVTLDKSEFNIVFEFSEPMGLLINSSFKKKTYKLASKGKPKSQLPGFQNTGMAEGLLNPDKDIFMSDVSPNYWFYEDDQKNRFNAFEKVNDKIQCKRTIQNLFEIDTKHNIKIEDVKKPVYLVFISYKPGLSRTEEIELKREWVKIKWNN